MRVFPNVNELQYIKVARTLIAVHLERYRTECDAEVEPHKR